MTFTATVSVVGVAGVTSPTPAGTVTFYDGTTALGTESLNTSNQATLTTSSLAPGTHSIVAVYSGDSLTQTNQSVTLGEIVATTTQSVVYVNAAWAGDPNLTPVTVGGNMLTIGINAFATIQGGVDGVASGGTVNVLAGNYSEQVLIGQSLSIAGAGASSTILSAPSGATGGSQITISGGSTVSVTISGLSLSGSSLLSGIAENSGASLTTTGVAISGDDVGISVQSASMATITGSSITGDGTGIWVANAGTATVTQSAINGCTTGILVGNGGGDVAVLTAQQDDLSGNVMALSDVQNTTVSTAPAAVATSDWWGSLHGPSTSANPGGAGSALSGNVSFSPWIGKFTSSGSPGFVATINVVYAVPTQLVFTTEPSSSAGFGAQFAQQPVVEAEDASGNLGINFDSTSVPGSQVNLAMNVTSGAGTLAGTFPVNAVGGFVTFTNLSITHHGAYTLTATALPTGNPWSSLITTSGTSTTITVSPAASPPTVTVTDASGPYKRLPFTASATISPNDGSPSMTLQGQGMSFVYYVGNGTSGTNLGSTAPTNVGTYTVVATFPGSTDYATASNSTSFTISPVSLTITAAASSKTYSGTTAAATAPTITSGAVVSGDTAGFIETYASKNVGTGLSLTPSGVVNDGNSGKNYTYTYVAASSGVITAAPLTVTAAASSKTYDGTTAATATPSITSGTVMPGDAAGFIETYASKNVGTGLSLTPSGVVNDGNSGKNYTYTYAAASSGVITARALTVTAVADSKTYDLTTAAAVIPTITAGSIAPGDTANFVETFDTPNLGTGKTLTPSGSVSDGNSGNNYAYTFVPVSTGVITAASSDGWPSYALNAQHTATSLVASQPLDSILWQAPVDLQPQYDGSELLIHYGSPILTASNTVIIPVKTGTTSGFEIQARSGSSGALQWTLASDYSLEPSGGTNGYDWIPSYSPTLTPQNGLYYPADGGTVMYVASPDATGPSPPAASRLAFYGLSSYTANSSAYNSNIFINTPITSDSSGDIFFGFLALAGNGLGLTSGVARIGANGVDTWVPVVSGMSQVATNSAPALSNDGSTLYVLESTGNRGSGKLVALNSQSLAVTAQVTLIDPHTGNDASISNDATASPMVGPDGQVYIGVLESSFASNNDRGWLLHFSANLSQTLTPGAFGWDDTPSVVPASMVPSYHGTSTYLLMVKYNNYAGLGTGNGLNQIAILDPNATETDPVTGTTVMNPVLSILGQTPDPDDDQKYPGAVREWCINSAAVDPATDSILAGSEDGKLYRWNLSTNTFTQVATLTTGIGEAYTPTLIGPDGMVYAINNATLFAVGDSVAASFKITGYPSPDTAGTASNFTVTVYNAEGDVDTAYTGTVQFTSSDQQAGLPGSYTFTTGTGKDNGTHTFSATLKTAGTQYLKATDTTTSSITGTDSGIVVQPAGAASLKVTGLPGSVTSGVASNFTVTAYDPYGNIATGYTGKVHFTSSDSSAVLPADYPFNTGNAGTQLFTATLNSTGTQTIFATDTVTSSITGSESTTVNPSGAASATFVKLDTTTQGNWENVYGTQGYDIISDAVKIPSYATVALAGQTNYTWSTTTSDVRGLQIPGSTNRVEAAWYSSTSFTIAVNLNDGQAHDIALYACDVDKNGRAEQIQISSASGGAILDTRTISNFQGGEYLQWNVTGNVIIKITRQAGSNGIINGLFFDPAATAGAASQLAVSGPTSVTAGTPFNVTVTAKDSSGNVATGYTGTVQFASGDSLAGLPSSYTFTTGAGNDNGVHTFSVTLKTAGTQYVKATDTTTSSITGTDSGIVVQPAGAASLTVAGFPTPDTAGVANNFTVTAYDAYGNVATGYTGTVAIASSDSKAGLPGSYTFTTGTGKDNGTHTFSATLKTAGTQYLKATDTTTSSITGSETGIVVQPAGAASLTVAGFPTPDTAGVANNFTVTAYDPYGNVATGYTGTVAIASSDSKAGLPGSYTFTTGTGKDNGTHTFSATLKTAGTQYLKATDTTTSSITGTDSGIVVQAAGAASLAVTGLPGSVTSGVASNFTVTAYDPYGNIATGYTGKVHFTSSDSSAVLPADYPFNTGNAGTQSFTATLNSTGTQTIFATDTVTSSITGSESTTVNPSGAASATFVKLDTTTQGNWENVYGTQGYDIISDAVKIPSYATVTLAGQTNYTWSTTTSDVRGLQIPGSTNRVEAAWYSSTSFTIAVNLNDGQAHDIALYACDVDKNGRAEQIQISSASGGAILDTRTISNFQGGEYLQWNVTGNVIIKITRQAGANGVINGLFFDPASVGGSAMISGQSAAAQPGNPTGASIQPAGIAIGVLDPPSAPDKSSRLRRIDI